MRQHTPHVQSDARPLPYFPLVDDASSPSEPDVDVDVDLSDLREPTPVFLLLEYRRHSEVGVEMDDAFIEAEEALPDQPSRARSLVGKLAFTIVFGGILGLLGYQIWSLQNASWQPLLQEFHRP